MIRFSCADYTFPTLTRLQTLKLLKLLEFDFVDIGLFARSDHYSPAQLSQFRDAYINEARSELETVELSVANVFLQAGLEPSQGAVNSPNPLVLTENRVTFERALEFCTALECRHLTGLPGVFHPDSDAHQDIALATQEAIWRVDRCAAEGVQYAIEPHIGSVCPDVDSTFAFLKCAYGLTLTLDYGHFIYSGQTSEQVHSLLSAASHIHVRGAAPKKLQTSFRENTIDFFGALRRLKQRSYQGLLALEYVWTDWESCNYSDNVAETTLLRHELEAAMQQIDKEDRGDHV